MDRRTKVELFGSIWHEQKYGAGTIRGVARKPGVHRRMVRQAAANAVPPERKHAVRNKPAIGPVAAFIDEILVTDRTLPRKRRHTAHRIWVRLCAELPGHKVSESGVRRFVRLRREHLGLARTQVFVPQDYQMGEQTQVDWYCALFELEGARVELSIPSMRSMFSGAAIHIAYQRVAYQRATQQALLEAHETAFDWFGGVFPRLRYDNMSSLVRRVMRGHQRQETDRFIKFRSHWNFEAEFRRPRQPQEKGGVEGEIGYFRRNHLVPVPSFPDLAAVNAFLRRECEANFDRIIGDRTPRTGELFLLERDALAPMAAEGFDLAGESVARVDAVYFART